MAVPGLAPPRLPYPQQALGPGRDITGVSFTVPASLAEGTNLSAGSYLSVEAIPGTNPCLAVRYFIHWTVPENYPPGVVTAFARDGLLDRLDAIRRTLVIVR